MVFNFELQIYYPETFSLMTGITLNDDWYHVLIIEHSITLEVKFPAMANKQKSGIPIKKEAPLVQPQPEVRPSVEPVAADIPAEAPHIKPEEISPYDFPPPGEGLFPEIF